MIAAIYARRSHDDSDRSAEARSCERQIEHARRYAAARGWTVDDRHVYRDDAVSGAEWKHRPGWAALVAALAPRPPFEVLIVSELSRIGRDTVRTPAAVLQLEEAGVEIHSYLTGTPISLADEAGEMRTVLDSLLASWERRRAGSRTYDAHRRRAEAGAVTGGRVYGYQNLREGAGYVHRVIDEAEAAVVRRIFTLYAEGDGLTRIAKRLNRDGVPAPRHGTGSWAPTAVREILRRDLYHGVVVWNKTQKIRRRGTKAQRQRPAAEWLQREAPELAIVSADLWRLVEQRRARAASTFPGGRWPVRTSGADLVSAYLLSGLTTCAWCGGSLVGITRPHGPTGARRRVPMYGCSYHQKRGRVVCKNDVVIRQDALDAAVLDALAEALDARLLAQAVTVAVERRSRGRRGAEDERVTVRRERAALETSMRHLVDAVKRGRATDTLLAALAEQETQAKALDRTLADLERQPVVAIDKAALTARLTDLTRRLREILTERSPKTRQLLQRVLNGRRVPCVPFREAGRRGYRFREERIPYAGVLSNDIGGPNGIRTRV